MQCKYTTDLPFHDLKRLIQNENSNELWIIFAYYSTELVKDIFHSIQKRKNKPITHIAFSASSVNPLQEIIDDIFQMDDFFKEQGKYFNFHLIEEPLMHAKVIAIKTNEDVTIYIGSGNLTKKALSGNIEAGVILHPESSEATLHFIDDLMKKCQRQNSLEELKNRAIFSHFRKEILFLALEESKLRQSVLLRPRTLQSIFTEPDGFDQEETADADVTSTVNVKARNSINISILSTADRDKLFKSEKLLKTELKKLAIKVNGYGYVSSLWSMKQIETSDNPALKAFLKDLKTVRENYKSREYRAKMAEEIKYYLDQEAFQRNMSLGEDEKQAIEVYLKRFSMDVIDVKSPYRSLERLLTNVSSDSGSILSLLSPYKIGGDENSETNDGVLLPDQLNLIVMCRLAAKLRSPKPAKVPAVWWFDYALTPNTTVFKEEQIRKLEEIIDNISEQLEYVNLNECLVKFCEITRFNLALKYPQMNEAFVHSDTDKIIENEKPYVFVNRNKKRYNLNRFLPAYDGEKLPSEFDGGTVEPELKEITGDFILGNNMFFWPDEETGNTYLYLTHRQPL